MLNIILSILFFITGGFVYGATFLVLVKCTKTNPHANATFFDKCLLCAAVAVSLALSGIGAYCFFVGIL